MADTNPSTITLQSVTPTECWQTMQQNHRSVLIDVRSNMEFLLVGHPLGAIHVPWIDEPDWDINPNFVREVRKAILGGISHGNDQQTAPIFLICRSGNRSRDAGLLLMEKGFNHVYNVSSGFEGPLDESLHRSTLGGWRAEGLPWEQC